VNHRSHKEPEPKSIQRYFDSKVPNLRWRGDQGTGRCPFHDDKNPSFSANKAKRVFCCHSCGAKGGLVEFERLISECSFKTAKQRIAKLANRGGGSKLRPRIVTLYSYEDENGKLRYQQVRLEPKGFRFRRPDGNGGWIWNLHGVTKILYHLAEVIATNKVFVAEGEKDVETLRDLGFIATCNPGGAGKWADEYSKYLTGKKVVVLQDKDVAKHATQVRLVAPFDDAKDFTEWMERGGTRKGFEKLVSETKPFESALAPTATAVESLNDAMLPDDWRAKPLRGVWTVAIPENFFLDYLVLPSGIAFVAALWTIATHMFEAFDSFTYLAVTSPTKRCGKTRAGEILELLCARPILSVNLTEAAIFRSIAKEKPTLIIDEAEALRNRESERAKYVLSILQSGYRQGAVVRRCSGRNFEVEKFPVYCPKAILAIGNLPDTLMDRSIVISMRRRLPTEVVARFRRRSASEQAVGIVNIITSWVEHHKDEIAKAYAKEKLDFLADREADIWEPLFAIASIAVPDRLDELKQIATRLSSEKAGLDVDDTEGLRLLADIRTIFGLTKQRFSATAQLISKLKSNMDSHWGEDLTPIKLARLLRPFGISPRQKLIGESNVRGYVYEELKSAFDRYLSPENR
jgi:Protein of unknown function (DUF3631)/CHC2 zinc finger